MPIFKGENLGDTFKARIGPAPVWAWTVIGVLGVIWYMRKHQSSSSTDSSYSGSGSSNALPTEVVQGGAVPYTTTGDTFVNVTVGGGPPPKPGKKPPKPIVPSGANRKKEFKDRGGVWEWESNKWENKEKKKTTRSDLGSMGKQTAILRPGVPKRHTVSTAKTPHPGSK